MHVDDVRHVDRLRSNIILRPVHSTSTPENRLITDHKNKEDRMSTIATTENYKAASADISAASDGSKKIKWENAPQEQVNEYLVRQQLKGASSSIIRCYASKGGRPIRSTIPGESYLWVVGGRLHVDIDGQSVVLNPGEALQIPANKPQMITVEEDALYIAFITNG